MPSDGGRAVKKQPCNEQTALRDCFFSSATPLRSWLMTAERWASVCRRWPTVQPSLAAGSAVCSSVYNVLQSRIAVSAYLWSKQILLFGFAWQCNTDMLALSQVNDNNVAAMLTCLPVGAPSFTSRNIIIESDNKKLVVLLTSQTHITLAFSFS